MIDVNYFDKIPIQISGDLGFCDGYSTAINIISSHYDISLNNIGVNSPIEINNPGYYLLTGYDLNACIDSLEFWIEEYPEPIISAQDMIDIQYYPGLELHIDYLGDIVSYSWSPTQGLDCFDCPYPTLISDIGGNYTVLVKNAFGCEASETIIVNFKKIELHIPNVIANNSDINGSFYIKTNIDVKYDLQIFDRWGELIFDANHLDSNDPYSGWQPSGKFNPGVYVYKITLEDNGIEKVIAGDVTLL
ncbi:MAG: gliding motility-associated C-terminal domain-containing protein [Saprospiraceae bacterium]